MVYSSDIYHSKVALIFRLCYCGLMQDSTVADKNILKKLNLFFDGFKTLKFNAGEIITRSEDPLTNIYYIKKGCVRIYSISEQGEDVTLHIARAGSFFPMMLVLGKAKTNYYSESLTKVDLRQAPSTEVIKFIQKEQDVLFDLTRRFALGLCGMMVRIENLVTNPAFDRLELLIAYFAKNHGEKSEDGVTINIPLTHSMIGSWLGLSRETISRQIKKLQDMDLIDYRGRRLLVKDIKSLHKI